MFLQFTDSYIRVRRLEVEYKTCGFLVVDLIVVIASIVVLSAGSNGQVFATSAIRQVIESFVLAICIIVLNDIMQSS